MECRLNIYIYIYIYIYIHCHHPLVALAGLKPCQILTFNIPQQGRAGLHSQSPHNFAWKFMRLNITKHAVFPPQSLQYTYYLSRHLHRYDCTNTQTYRRTNLRNILICDFSLESPAAEARDFVKLMLLYQRQVLRLILRQKHNGTLSRDRILKGYGVAGLPQLNTFCLILQLVILQILRGFSVQTARYAVNSVIIRVFHVMIYIMSLEHK